MQRRLPAEPEAGSPFSEIIASNGQDQRRTSSNPHPREQPDEEHAADRVVVVHEEFELGPGNPPDDGGLCGENTGGRGTRVEDGNFAERVARF